MTLFVFDIRETLSRKVMVKADSMEEAWDFKTVNLGLTDGGVTYSKVGYDVLAEYAKKVTA